MLIRPFECLRSSHFSSSHFSLTLHPSWGLPLGPQNQNEFYLTPKSELNCFYYHLAHLSILYASFSSLFIFFIIHFPIEWPAVKYFNSVIDHSSLPSSASAPLTSHPLNSRWPCTPSWILLLHFQHQDEFYLKPKSELNCLYYYLALFPFICFLLIAFYFLYYLFFPSNDPPQNMLIGSSITHPSLRVPPLLSLLILSIIADLARLRWFSSSIFKIKLNFISNLNPN
jgi:hypothetical protein